MQLTNSRLLGAALLSGMLAAPAQAQVPLTPRALGMGGAYVAVARGNETIFLNPANLGLADNPSWSFALPQVAFGGTVLGPSFADLPDLRNYDDLEQSRRDEILALIPESGTEARYDFRLPFAAFQNGNFALGVSYGSVGQHTAGKDLAELLINGYEEGRTDYGVGDTRGSRASFWDFAAAYGRRAGPVSVGVTAHYIHGGSVLRSRLFEPQVDVDRRDIAVDYRSVYAKGGSGYGLDVGIAYQPAASLTLSAAVSNLYSRMEWSEELYTRSLTLSSADFDSQDALGLWDRYEASEVRVDANAAPLAVHETLQGLYDDAFLPAVARVGAAWKGTHGTDLGVSFQDRLTEGRLGDGWDRILGAGIQQKLIVGSLRAGYATNLDEGSLLTGGLSLGPLQLGAARMTDADLNGASRSGWIGSFGIGVKTPY